MVAGKKAEREECTRHISKNKSRSTLTALKAAETHRTREVNPFNASAEGGAGLGTRWKTSDCCWLSIYGEVTSEGGGGIQHRG